MGFAQIAKRRDGIFQQRQQEQQAIHDLGLNPEAAMPAPSLAEAGFITPRGGDAGFVNENAAPLVTYNQPMATYASPGFVEAGHRRPEDLDPMQMEDYRQAYNRQLTDFRGRL